ncbi:MAG: hypothetical protein ACSHYF_10095 [Verrucomicrobiaceae bacterium]
MILRIVITICLVLPCFSLEIPNLSKVFPGSQLVTKTEKGLHKTSFYATDQDFAELKVQLLKALGKGWVEIKVKTMKDEKENKDFQKAARAIDQTVTFTHPENDKLRLTLTTFNTPLMGKVRAALLNLTQSK